MLMRFTIQKEDLLYAVNAVERAASGKNTLPILSGVMIRAKDGLVSFCATDLELAIECVMPAEISEEGEAVTPGRKFSSLARLLPTGEIMLSQSGSGQLRIDYQGSHVYVPCFPPEEFPVLPAREGAIEGQIPVRLFRRMVRQVSIAAAQDELRPVFTGIYTELKPGQIVMVATDTHRLARAIAAWQGEGQLSLNIPARAMQEAARLAVNDEDTILITASENQVYFSFANLTFTSRVIGGQYPDYNQVIPAEEKFISHALLDRQRLSDSLERAALISRESGRGRGNVAELDISQNLLSLSAQAADEGAISESLPIMLSGDPMQVNYNVRYLLDVLKVIEEPQIILHLTGQLTPGVIVPAENGEAAAGGESYLYLLLPIRVSR